MARSQGCALRYICITTWIYNIAKFHCHEVSFLAKCPSQGLNHYSRKQSTDKQNVTLSLSCFIYFRDWWSPVDPIRPFGLTWGRILGNIFRQTAHERDLILYDSSKSQLVVSTIAVRCCIAVYYTGCFFLFVSGLLGTQAPSVLMDTETALDRSLLSKIKQCASERMQIRCNHMKMC